MRNKIFFLFLLLLVSSSAVLAGDEARRPDNLVLETTLEEISRLALENCLDIQIAGLDIYIRRTELDRAFSLFDIFLKANADYSNDETRSASSFSGSQTNMKTYSLGLNKTFSSGTDIGITASEQRTWTDSSFVSDNPLTESFLEISLTQALGKNFFGLADRSRIALTRLDIANSEFTSLETIETLLRDVQVAYWTLILKDKELAISRELRQEAERLYLVYQENFKLGLVEEGDLYAAEANLRIQENNVIQAELAKDTAEQELFFLLNIENSDMTINPLETLALIPEPADLYQSLNRAVISRRDYAQTKNRLEARNISLAVSKNSLWPEIDITASYLRNGLDPGRSRAWQQVNREDNEELFIGLSLSTPLERRKERADLEQARLEKEQALLSLKKIERLILKDIHVRVQKINSLKKQVELFSAAEKLQQRKLDEEMLKLKYGRSDADTVIRYENDVLDARLALARAYFAYRAGLIDLELAENTLLNKYWDLPAAKVERKK